MNFNQTQPSFRAPTAQQPFEMRRGQVERLQATQGGYHRIFGFVGVNLPGEAIVTLPFAVAFISKPLFTWGIELAADSDLTPGAYPSATACVASWDRRITGDQLAEYFYGANVAINTTGHSLQRFILHWQFMGPALVGPGPSLAPPGDDA